MKNKRFALNKGAMFGLDARIALVIFGALSVISGAALYNAIEESKITAFHQEYLEIAKAIDMYMLDTGQNIPFTSTSWADPDELFFSDAPNWKGPYLQDRGDDASLDNHYKDWPNVASQSSVLAIQYRTLDRAGTCSDFSQKCKPRITINSIPVDFAVAFDIYVDGESDRLTGDVVYSYHSNPSLVELHMYVNVQTM
jgi:hypothetical protein